MATTEEIKGQLDVLKALKAEYAANREEWSTTSNSARAAELKDDRVRLQNLIHDAAQEFATTFKDAFGIWPRELIDCVNDFGYAISKKYPTKQQLSWDAE